MRRRFIGQGFEGLELPPARGYRAVPRDDFDLMQGGELPRRVLVEQVPPRSRGPATWGEPLKRQGLLDQPAGQNIGRSSNITLLTGVAQSFGLLNLEGSDEAAKIMTVSLYRETIVAGFISDLFARVQWGSGGVQYEVDVDLRPGVTMNLSCSSIRIVVRGAGTGTYKVSAHIGYNAGGENTAQRTLQVGPLAIGASSLGLAIPTWAKTVHVLRTPVAANMTLQFWQGATLLAEVSVGNGPGATSEGYPIPLTADSVRLVNGLGAAVASSFLVFGLCL